MISPSLIKSAMFGRDRGTTAEFFASGQREIEGILAGLDGQGIRSEARHRALDFGCGLGRLTRALADSFDEVVGIERSESGWDSEMLAYPSVYEHRGTKHLLYNGNGFGASGIGHAVEDG